MSRFLILLTLTLCLGADMPPNQCSMLDCEFRSSGGYLIDDTRIGAPLG